MSQHEKLVKWYKTLQERQTATVTVLRGEILDDDIRRIIKEYTGNLREVDNLLTKADRVLGKSKQNVQTLYENTNDAGIKLSTAKTLLFKE